MNKNKKLRFVLISVVAVVLVFSGYLIVSAFSVSDDFSTSTKVASTWRTTVDTGAGVARLATKTCDSAVWFCGTGYDDVIVNELGDGNYILVAKADISTTKQWKSDNTACSRPQCDIDAGQNGDHLKADNTINFSSYPARDACKAIGGRLPTLNELTAIYTYRVTKFGNNFQSSSYYWSAPEYSATSAWYVLFSSGGTSNYNKANAFYVRCVSGW